MEAVVMSQPQPTTALAFYDAACAAVAKAKSVDEAKDIRDKAVAMIAYARQAKNRDMEADSVEIRMRATRRLDQMVKSQKETVGLATGGDAMKARVGRKPELDRPTLGSQGIDKSLAHQARTLGALSNDKFEAAVADARAAVRSDTRIVRGTLGTGENEWYTPTDVIRDARKVLGVIDLDPASSVQAQSTVQALQYFTLDDDGLKRMWHGNVWLNPPYAQPHIENFADKMILEIKSCRVSAAIMLTHNYTDTAWFQKLAAASMAICFPKGRIRFEAPDGTLAAPTQGQAFFYFGKEVASFAEVFTPRGFVVGALA